MASATEPSTLPNGADNHTSQNPPTVENTKSAKANGTAAAPTPAKPSASEAQEKKTNFAELKKQKKAEKAAKRAQNKETQGSVPESKGQASRAEQPTGAQPSSSKRGPAPDTQGQKHAFKGQQASAKQATSTPAAKASTKTSTESAPVALFAHLYGQPRRHTLEGAAKEVHPAVLALGLQMSSYEICGSNARCVAMLLAFKQVIQSYTTPPNTSLARHLTSHHLSPQIDYLKTCRPLSTSMGNAIRYLKDLIIKIDPAVPESTAKSSLLSAIDTFIRERITVADTVIAQTASSKIVDGDVVVTYAKSSIVLKTLLAAWEKGTRFHVVVIDSSPLFEGRRTAATLASECPGLSVTYTLIGAAAHAVKEATKVFVGAHAMMSNGMLYSRVGTAVVAMLAEAQDCPVIVCCESLKFSENVALESITRNEVAPSEELLGESLGGEREVQLRRWRDVRNLQMLNVMHDVTPAACIKMVVTEFGSLPPSSIPAALRNSWNSGM